MIFDFVIIASYGLLSLILGIIIGSMNHDHPSSIEKTVEVVKTIFHLDKNANEIEVGVYPRPTAHDLALLDEDPKKQEAKEEIKKSLDEIPELKAAREFVENTKR